MTKREAMRQAQQEATLLDLGFTRAEAEQLRRISMTLQRWFEFECGTGDGQVSRSIERDGDEDNSTPYMRVGYPSPSGYVERKWKIADRETGARKRLAAIIGARNARVKPADGETRIDPVLAYVQTDPRGAALYILRPGDVPEGKDVSAYYTRGICVY
jgi:hypothetical protein